MFAALLTAVFWSISVVCASRSAKMLGGSEANFWRLTCAAVFLAIWAHTFGSGFAGIAFPFFLWSGLIGIGVGDVALFQALPRLGSRLSILLVQCLSAPFAALIEYIWLGTTLSGLQMLCGFAALVGIALALSPGTHLTITRRQMVIGVIAGVIAALGNAFGAVLSRGGFALAATAGENPDGGTTAYQRVIGGLFIAGVCLLFVKRDKVRPMGEVAMGEKWRKVLPWVIANGLAGQTLGVSFYQLALKQVPTGVVLAITALTPLVIIPLAYHFEHERPQARSIIGGVIAVSGVIGLILSRL